MPARVIEAECDGKVLIPAEPLDLPVGKRIRLVIESPTGVTAANLAELWEDLAKRPARGPSPDADVLRRENLYDGARSTASNSTSAP